MGSGGQQGHQVFHTVLPTFIPDWVPEGLFEDLRSTILAGIQGSVNLQAFISQGHGSTQSVAVKNLAFPVVGPVEVIPYNHYNIEWDIDAVTDVDWLSTNDVVTILAVAGVVAIVASFFIGGPIAALLVGVGIFVLIAAGLLSITETVHEVINPADIWAFITSPLGLITIGIVGGYFVWTASGRGFVKTSAQKAVPYAKRGASAAARRLKRKPSNGNGKGILDDFAII